MDFMAFMEQMSTSDIALVAAFFIGLMTAISPCPMATNITAIAYVSRKIEDSRHTLIVGVLYTAGRTFTYTALASLIVYVGLNTQEIAIFLQNHGESILGPFLLLIGIVMLELFKFGSLTGKINLLPVKEKLAEKGYPGAFLLGVVLALAFCPFSGVLYFGMLIPLALKTGDAILVPSVFGLATGLPVILSSILLVKSVSTLGRTMNRVQAFEKGMRKVVGVVFILVGLYYSYLQLL
ncbi:MAG: aromatic aminobenezylarsenical efflux permease ArsG family transporter [Candidatus Micrarchaeota archaeon]